MPEPNRLQWGPPAHTGGDAEAAEENGLDITKDRAKEIVYGMPHNIWKEKYQTEASEDQTEKFKTSDTKDH